MIKCIHDYLTFLPADSDRNGTISIEEAMACIKMILLFTDSRFSEIPMLERVRVVMESFFRVFDANGNGVIEAGEVHAIITDLNSGLIALLTSLIDNFEPLTIKVSQVAF